MKGQSWEGRACLEERGRADADWCHHGQGGAGWMMMVMMMMMMMMMMMIAMNMRVDSGATMVTGG